MIVPIVNTDPPTDSEILDQLRAEAANPHIRELGQKLGYTIGERAIYGRRTREARGLANTVTSPASVAPTPAPLAKPALITAPVREVAASAAEIARAKFSAGRRG